VEAGRVGSSNLNPGYTTLAASISTTSASTISVTKYAGFPSTGNYYIMVDSEQMQVTGGQGTATWTVTRGTNGTTPATHTAPAYVFQSATTIIPIDPLFFDPVITRYLPKLMRYSFEAYYETAIVSEKSDVKGLKHPATYETLVPFLSWAVKGGVSPSALGGGAYSWLFNPSLQVDDIAGMGAEFFTDTAAYHIAALYCDQLVIDIVRGTDTAQLTADFMGQLAFQMGAKTPALTTPVAPGANFLNLVNPAYTASYLDTSVIGTTLNNDLVSAKATLKNGIQQLYFLNGVLYSTAIARPVRSLALEVVQWFDDSSELANAMNSVGNGTERKIRLLSTGPAIGTSGYDNSLDIDWYGYWTGFPFKVDKDVWHVTFTGESVYDPGAGRSWGITLQNGLSAAV
jgi:hypothetical protein